MASAASMRNRRPQAQWFQASRHFALGGATLSSCDSGHGDRGFASATGPQITQREWGSTCGGLIGNWNENKQPPQKKANRIAIECGALTIKCTRVMILRHCQLQTVGMESAHWPCKCVNFASCENRVKNEISKK